MIVGVKYTNGDGEPNGREYTYYGDDGLTVGEIIEVPVKNTVCAAVVTRINIPESEVESFRDNIKTIGEDYTDAEAGDAALADLHVDATLPVIKTNFGEIRKNLGKHLLKYKNLVVTEETLSLCKAKQKELAGLRTRVDAYRKDKKRELSKPIDAFEAECREIEALIGDVEKPLKEGIAVFDDVKRNGNRETALRLMKEIADGTGLTERYAARLTVPDRCRNTTAKEREIRSDITAEAMTLKVEQDREAELLGIIRLTIEAENKRLNSKMELSQFERLMDGGLKTADVIAEIKSRADMIHLAENPPPEGGREEPQPEAAAGTSDKGPPVHGNPGPHEAAETHGTAAPAGIYRAAYIITGTERELMSVSAHLKDNRIAYSVASQEEL